MLVPPSSGTDTGGGDMQVIRYLSDSTSVAKDDEACDVCILPKQPRNFGLRFTKRTG